MSQWCAPFIRYMSGTQSFICCHTNVLYVVGLRLIFYFFFLFFLGTISPTLGSHSCEFHRFSSLFFFCSFHFVSTYFSRHKRLVFQSFFSLFRSHFQTTVFFPPKCFVNTEGEPLQSRTERNKKSYEN